MIRAHQLLDDIERRRINVLTNDQASRREALVRDIAPAIRAAQKFDFTALAGRDLTDATNFGLDLLADDQPPFPYDLCYFDWDSGMPHAGLLWGNDVFLFVKPFPNAPWGDLCTVLRYGPKDEMRVHVAPDTKQSRLDDIKKFSEVYRDMSWDILGCFTALSSKICETKIEGASERVNLRRMKQGKPPLFEHTIVMLPAASHAHHDQGGTHASPRLHWRRGHIRTLSAGYQVKVRPHLVGDLARGFVSHDYVAR